MGEELLHEVFEIPLWTVIGRLGLAVILGGLIGFEREMNHKSAGLRTNMLTALAAASFSMLCLYSAERVMEQYGSENELLRIDPLRAFEAVSGAAAVLAAGAVIASRGEVRGMTTGVTLWLTAAVGAGAGLGFYGLAIVATIFALIALALVQRLTPRQD